jgi:hypothetical protein
MSNEQSWVWQGSAAEQYSTVRGEVHPCPAIPDHSPRHHHSLMMYYFTALCTPLSKYHHSSNKVPDKVLPMYCPADVPMYRCTSQDLVHWELLPHAILPTPGSVDSAGCFSGCAALDDNNMPTLLYTGVRMRGQADAGPLPPKESDLGLPFIETQLLVHAEDPIGKGMR